MTPKGAQDPHLTRIAIQLQALSDRDPALFAVVASLLKVFVASRTGRPDVKARSTMGVSYANSDFRGGRVTS